MAETKLGLRYEASSNWYWGERMTECVEKSIDAKELRFVIVTCKKCQVEFRLDAKNKIHEQKFGMEPIDDLERNVFDCPFCGGRFDKPMRVAFHALCRFIYYADLQSSLRLLIEIPVPSKTLQIKEGKKD